MPSWRQRCDGHGNSNSQRAPVYASVQAHLYDWEEEDDVHVPWCKQVVALLKHGSSQNSIEENIIKSCEKKKPIV